MYDVKREKTMVDGGGCGFGTGNRIEASIK